MSNIYDFQDKGTLPTFYKKNHPTNSLREEKEQEKRLFPANNLWTACYEYIKKIILV